MEQQIEEYVRNNYKTTYGKCTNLIIEIRDTFFMVKDNKDGSPLILSNKILAKWKEQNK